MDSISQVLGLWANEAMIVIGVLFLACIYAFMSKIWKGASNFSLSMLLGTTLLAVGAIFYFARLRVHVYVTPHTLLFLLLYGWAALGLLFLAGRQTHPFKLFLGLIAEAAVLYALYHYT